MPILLHAPLPMFVSGQKPVMKLIHFAVLLVVFLVALLTRAQAPGRPVEIVPTAQSKPATWRYTLRQPANDWARPGFDDGKWEGGRSGFGTAGTPGSVVNTNWDTADI